VATVLITGANRGLGLEFARQYAQDGWRVLATCRDPSRADALSALGSAVTVYPLDVSDFAAVAALGRELAAAAIDVMIANAGVLLNSSMSTAAIDTDAWTRSFQVNAMAPLACAGAFLGAVARSNERKMIAIGSLVGSIGAATQGGIYTYRSSKAALNSVWRSFALDHPEVIATVLSPGRMRTEMVRNEASGWDSLPPPDKTASKLRALIARLTQADSGGFIHHNGKTLPW